MCPFLSCDKHIWKIHVLHMHLLDSLQNLASCFFYPLLQYQFPSLIICCLVLSPFACCLIQSQPRSTDLIWFAFSIDVARPPQSGTSKYDKKASSAKLKLPRSLSAQLEVRIASLYNLHECDMFAGDAPDLEWGTWSGQFFTRITHWQCVHRANGVSYCKSLKSGS